jgi:hypothetical protein
MKNNGEHCDHCGTHWEETDGLHKVDGQWTCSDCTCPSVIEG